jgi:hypothetical protein
VPFCPPKPLSADSGLGGQKGTDMSHALDTCRSETSDNSRAASRLFLEQAPTNGEELIVNSCQNQLKAYELVNMVANEDYRNHLKYAID